MKNERTRRRNASSPAYKLNSGLRALAAAAGLLVASEAGAISFTPGGICTDAGFTKGDSFRETCVSRVLQERRSRAWREQAPYALLGAVAGVAANGGTAVGFVSVPGETGVRRVDLDGQSYLVRVIDASQATVMSVERYKNIPKADVELWGRAAAIGTGCTITRQVKDFDALYVWTACSSSSPPVPTDAPTVAQVSADAVPSLADELAKLTTMHDRGALSLEEFQAAKAKLLTK